MNRLQKLYGTSIGKKFIAALTGIIMFGFLVGHLAGNLKVFTGSSEVAVEGQAEPAQIPHIDEYGHFLRIAGTPLVPKLFVVWATRIVLLFSVIIHVIVVIQLSLQNQAARPVGYVKSKKSAASPAALYMMVSGSLILGFIIFHILHFTTGTIQLGEFEHGLIYKNISQSFAMWPVALGYAVMMVVLGVHLYHGLWSLFQTLGLDNADRNKFLRGFAIVFSVGLAIGFASIPIAFMTGAMPEPVEYLHSLLTDH